MYLFFDTETSGLPKNYKAPITDLDNWPRVIQLAWLTTEEDGTEIASHEYLIKPIGFVIPEEASKVHGITTEMAMMSGVSIITALKSITPDIINASTIIAHNIAFDEKVLGAEYLRLHLENVLTLKKRICTMLSSVNHCKIPGKYGNKWPTLDELHTTLFNESVVNAHNALADVRACTKCFFKLKQLYVL